MHLPVRLLDALEGQHHRTPPSDSMSVPSDPGQTPLERLVVAAVVDDVLAEAVDASVEALLLVAVPVRLAALAGAVIGVAVVAGLVGLAGLAQLADLAAPLVAAFHHDDLERVWGTQY